MHAQHNKGIKGSHTQRHSNSAATTLSPRLIAHFASLSACFAVAGTELTINYDLFDECAKTPVPRCIVFCRCGEEECTRTII